MYCKLLLLKNFSTASTSTGTRSALETKVVYNVTRDYHGPQNIEVMLLKNILESGPTSPLIYSGPYLRTAQQKLQKIIFKIAIESHFILLSSRLEIKVKIEVKYGLEIED